jgi:hypothetical protein
MVALASECQPALKKLRQLILKVTPGVLWRPLVRDIIEDTLDGELDAVLDRANG